MSSNPNNIEILMEQKQKLLDDLCYVLYYPKHLKYIALFSKSDDTDELESNNSSRKVKQIQIKAYKLAQENRQHDIYEGNVDRVEHAIDVEFTKTSKKRPAQSDTSHRNYMDKKRTNLSTNIQNDDDETKNQINMNDSDIPRHKKFRGSHKKQEPANEKEDHIESKLISDPPPKSDVLDSTMRSSSSKSKHLDSFFIADDSTGIEETTIKQPTQIKIPIGEIKRYSNAKKGRKTIIENDGTMTKQELRLLNWQLKVRGRSVRR